MANLKYIKINGNAIRRPVEFKPERTDIYAAEITTMTGKTIADVVGWKYADLTMSWSALPQSEVETLVNMSGENTIVFDDPSGDELTETVIRSSVVEMRHPYLINGVTWWRNVSVSIRFINAHN